MAAERGVPEPGVLDPGDQFWLEAMADAVLILSPVRGRNQHVTRFPGGVCKCGRRRARG